MIVYISKRRTVIQAYQSLSNILYVSIHVLCTSNGFYFFVLNQISLSGGCWGEGLAAKPKRGPGRPSSFQPGGRGSSEAFRTSAQRLPGAFYRQKFTFSINVLRRTRTPEYWISPRGFNRAARGLSYRFSVTIIYFAECPGPFFSNAPRIIGSTPVYREPGDSFNNTERV